MSVTLEGPVLCLYDKQQEFLDSPAWMRGFVAGRGSGKSTVGALAILLESKNGWPSMAVSRSYPAMMDSAWPVFLHEAHKLGVFIRKVESPIPTIHFRTQDGGVASCTFRTGEEPESLRGPSKAILWLDEASYMLEEVFNVGIAILRHEGTMGRVLLTFTPKGKRHWTFKRFYEVEDDGSLTQKPNTSLTKAHTGESPFLPESYLGTLQSQYSSALARQELAGEFVDLLGLMFYPEWFDVMPQGFKVPVLADRVRYWDKACLTAGTLVATSRGQKPIERVRAGDLVLTRNGYCRVKWAGLTKRVWDTALVRFSNGAVVSGTVDHLVWTENRNWVELASLRATDKVLCCNLKGEQQWRDHETSLLRQSCSTACGTPASLGRDTSLRTDGTRCKSDIGTSRCTAPFGASIEATSPLGITFTTRTTTGTTTRSRILSASRGESTCSSTVRNSGRQSTGRCLNGFDRLRSNGPAATNTPQNTGSKLLLAERPHGKARGQFNASVKNADEHSPELLLDTSQGVAATIADTEGVGVYDIQVEGCHEFFANGILVHNSSEGEPDGNNGPCFTAGVLMARDKTGTFYVEDVVRGRWSYLERNKIIRHTAERDAAKYDNRVLIFMEQEPGSGGKESSLVSIRELAGFPVKADKVTRQKRERLIAGEKLPGEAKIVRAHPFAAQAEARNVKLISAKWVDEWLDELAAFPLQKITDQVDATSGAFNMLVKHFGPLKQLVPKKEVVGQSDPGRYGVLVAPNQTKRDNRGNVKPSRLEQDGWFRK